MKIVIYLSEDFAFADDPELVDQVEKGTGCKWIELVVTNRLRTLDIMVKFAEKHIEQCRRLGFDPKCAILEIPDDVTDWDILYLDDIEGEEYIIYVQNGKLGRKYFDWFEWEKSKEGGDAQ